MNKRNIELKSSPYKSEGFSVYDYSLLKIRVDFLFTVHYNSDIALIQPDAEG